MTNLINPSLVVNVYDAEAERNKIENTFDALEKQIRFSINDAKSKIPNCSKDFEDLFKTLRGDIRSERTRFTNEVKKPKIDFQKYDDSFL